MNDVHAYFSPYVYSVNSSVNIVSKDFCLGNPPPGSCTVPFLISFHKNQVSVPKFGTLKISTYMYSNCPSRMSQCTYNNNKIYIFLDCISLMVCKVQTGTVAFLSL